MGIEGKTLTGGDVMPALAAVYPQLFLTPGPEGAEAYRAVVLQGGEPPLRSLAHFRGDEGDSLAWETTPAGTVPVITLRRREDFELFLQIMACRCVPAAIPATQGASILDGVINWTKIRAHREEFLRARGPEGDWEAEFARFTSEKKNYTDALIVLSWGPYSAVGAEKLGLPESVWLERSHTIRRFHECTHFICRRLFPEKKDAVWDELVADAAGIFAAYGTYDPTLAELFLGLEKGVYTGGRLENYLDGDQDRPKRLDALAKKIRPVLDRFAEIASAQSGMGPYEFAIRLEEEIGCWNRP